MDNWHADGPMGTNAAETAISSVLNLQNAFRVVELGLLLYAFLFPQQAVVEDNSTYDFIIVGAGSAGCVVAARLTENPNFNVLLIEDGDAPPVEVMDPGLGLFVRKSRFDWNYTSTDDKYAYQCYRNRGFEMTRGHGLGGSSGINFQVYARGNPYDYDLWASLVNDSSWDWDHVLPYFKKGERLEDPTLLNSQYANLYGSTGDVGINKFPDPSKVKYLNALEEVGYKTTLETNGRDTLGFNFPTYTISNGTRQSSCFCHLSPVKDRTNLHVLRNTKVTKILFNGTQAIGVQIIDSSGSNTNILADIEVILSAGAINTPQLLMLSGIGPKNHLKSFNIPVIADLPVGFNLQDHIGVFVAHRTEPYSATNKAGEFSPFRPALNTIIGYVPKNSSVTYPDIQFIMNNAKSADAYALFFAFTLFLEKDIVQRAYSAVKGSEVLFNYILHMRPASRGRILLNSTNINDPPKVLLGAYSNDTDLVTVINAAKDYITKIENSTFFQSVNASRIDLTGGRCSGFDMNSDAYWRCYTLCLTVSIYDYTSTCSMGTVVDTKLRVKGIQGLRVADSSVYTIAPSANINAPTMMIGEKAADLIKLDYFFLKKGCCGYLQY